MTAKVMGLVFMAAAIVSAAIRGPNLPTYAFAGVGLVAVLAGRRR